jgi:hypothetical protein
MFKTDQNKITKNPNWWIFRLIIIALILVSAGYMLTLPLERMLFSIDFTEYWSSSRLLLTGENPYSVEAGELLTKDFDWPRVYPVVMFNPPWVLGVILPLGLLPYNISHLVWLFFNIVIILVCSDLSWQLYKGPPNLRWISWILGIFFIPAINCLHFGQITPLILLGIVGFLYFVEKKKWLLAGCAAFLVSIKPVLLILFWVAFFLWVYKSKHWSTLWACAATGLVALLVPFLIDPNIISQYLNLYSVSPLYEFELPLFSFVLRLIFGLDIHWLQYLPTLLGVIWLVFYWYRHNNHWEWLKYLPLVIMVSFVTASYGWSFDQIVFIPVLMQSAIWISKNIQKRWPFVIGYFIIYIFMIKGMLPAVVVPFWDIWQPIALLTLYLVLYIYVQHKNEFVTDYVLESYTPK